MPTSATPEPPKPNGTEFESVALLLQGGGALGAYQAGVYQALSERGIEPTWIAGISIGSINSAIIAGNAANDRVAKLREFWETVTAATIGWSSWADLFKDTSVRGFINSWAAG